MRLWVIILFFVSLFFLFSAPSCSSYSSSEAFQTEPSLQTQACTQLMSAKTDLETKVATMRSQVQDMSGIAWSEINWRTENLQAQKNNLAACTANLSTNCTQLAGMDNLLYKSIPPFISTNDTIFTSEYNIEQQLQAVNDTLTLVGCSIPLVGPGSLSSFTVIKNTGYIDTPRLQRAMLQLSPYYISPDVLQYISRLLTDTPASIANFQSASANSASITNNIQTINGIIGKVLTS